MEKVRGDKKGSSPLLPVGICARLFGACQTRSAYLPTGDETCFYVLSHPLDKCDICAIKNVVTPEKREGNFYSKIFFFLKAYTKR